MYAAAVLGDLRLAPSSRAWSFSAAHRPATRVALPSQHQRPRRRPLEPAPAEASGDAAARISQSIGFAGFGPATFGSSPEAVRQAWGRGLDEGPGPAEGSTCRYLIFAAEKGAPYRIAFMIEDEKFVRIDVASPDYIAPGGGRVGMSADEIRALYPGRVEESPHKYVEGGKYLIVAPEDGGPARLVFEVDAAGRITEWRVGVPPQVHYVEGCS